jgi:hypothetical protein
MSANQSVPFIRLIPLVFGFLVAPPLPLKKNIAARICPKKAMAEHIIGHAEPIEVYRR